MLIITLAFLGIRRHYDRVAEQVRPRPTDVYEIVRHTVVVLVSGPTRPAVHAIRYAQAMRPDHLFALTVVQDGQGRADLEKAWDEVGIGVPLEVIEDDYRDFTTPIEAFLTRTDARWADDTLTVVRGHFGSYPNFLFEVEADDVDDFVDELSALRSDADLEKFAGRYGVRRSSKHFWETVDWLHADLRRRDPTQAGLYDLDRYGNL